VKGNVPVLENIIPSIPEISYTGKLILFHLLGRKNIQVAKIKVKTTYNIMGLINGGTIFSCFSFFFFYFQANSTHKNICSLSFSQ